MGEGGDYRRRHRPATVSPELGGETALRALARAAHAHDMGLVLDIVPNHMAAHLDNAWWRDVVVRGRRSPWARSRSVGPA